MSGVKLSHEALDAILRSSLMTPDASWK